MKDHDEIKENDAKKMKTMMMNDDDDEDYGNDYSKLMDEGRS